MDPMGKYFVMLLFVCFRLILDEICKKNEAVGCDMLISHGSAPLLFYSRKVGNSKTVGLLICPANSRQNYALLI